jgi:mono/diheme cytochrome c family protein
MGPIPLILLASVAAPVDYARDVEPILRRNCHACHGPAQHMNGLRLDRPEDALRGSYSGPVILPGRSAESKLLQMVAGQVAGKIMPPAGARLAAAEIAILRAWIDQGARFPLPAAKTQHLTPALWRPVRRPAVPSGAGHPIDAFVRAALQAKGIEPSPEADRVTLIRRVSLDLTGLPPTPEEVDEFVADRRPEAYERVVDRLLASPHYGEKWARHWLDLARYADSDGFEKDLFRPWAWRWRHWVIEALNRDLPFDQFTIQQIAGDLLPNATVEQRVATGFQRNTLKNREAGVKREEARFEELVDQTNTVATVWLGLTLRCAQCHDHKYDPITQKDYYQLFAFFNSAEEADIDAPLPGEMGPYLRLRPEYEAKRRAVLEQFGIPALQSAWEPRMIRAMDDPGRDLDWDFSVTSMRAMVDHAERLLRKGPEKRSARESHRLTDYFLSTPGPDIAKDKEATERVRKAREKIRELDRTFPALSQAYTLAASSEPVRTYIALRGDYRRQGVEVEPNTPAALPPLPPGPEAARLRLARWLVSRENPLTARVAVNRMWQEFFGAGLARTSEDLGTQGEPPTHPELLDWLAAEFLDRGWSMKSMHRLIVTSATYRQSSRAREDLKDRDPDNRLLARQSRLRLSAELIRDAALAASGLLYPAVGGKSIRPVQPESISKLTYANGAAWQESEGPDRYRRGLYIHYQRTSPYPQLVNFDAPDSNTACARRRRSNSPLQALNLLNDPVFVEAAQALAARVRSEAAEGPARWERMFRLCLGRSPDPAERDRIATFYEQRKSLFELARALLNLDEFMTRE